jgi:hypothetical protein
MKRLHAVAACCLAFALPTAPAYAQVATRLAASISKSTCAYDSPATLKGTLTDADGKSIARKSVVLERDGSRVATSTTSSRGIVKRTVKYLGTAHWRWVFPGDASYQGSSSATKTTTASVVLRRTCAATRNEDGTSFLHLTFKLAKGHTYSFVLDHPALYFLGSVANYEHADQIINNTSGARSRFTFKAPRSVRYWAEWDWSADLNSVTATRTSVVIW